MLSYISTIILIVITYFVIRILPIKNDLKNKIFLLSAFLEFFIILATREPISDMIKYCQYYKNIGITSWNNINIFDWEKGYIILCKLLYCINNDERFFIVVTSMLSLIGPYIFLKRYSKDYLMSLIMFVAFNFFYYYYFVLRQVLGLSIILLSIKYIEEKKPMKYIALILLASLFHKSSIIFLICYFIFNMKINKQTYIFFGGTLLLLLPMKNMIVSFINRFFYDEYIGVQTTSGIILFLMMVIIAIILFFLNNNKEQRGSEKILFNQYIFAVLLQVLATSQSVIARLVIDFYIAVIVVLPNSINKITAQQRLTIKFIAYICIAIVGIINNNAINEIINI